MYGDTSKIPLNLKSMKMEVFNPKKIWFITCENEGYGFSFYIVYMHDQLLSPKYDVDIN